MRRLVRVAIVDSHPALLAGLRTLFEAEDGLQVVGEASDGDGALNLVGASAVDVVVVDERVAGAGTRPRRAALDGLAGRSAVVVTGMGEPALYAGAHLEAGAAAYWPKWGTVEALVAMVREAAALQPPAARLRVVDGVR